MTPLIEPGSPSGPREPGHAAANGPPKDDGPDLKRILKIFNYVNDDKRTKVNIKFLSLAVAFVVVASLLVAYAVWGPYNTTEPETGAAQERTEFVGLTPVEASLYGSDAELIDARLATWLEQHPNAEIVSVERAYNEDGLWVGYDITYRT